MMRTISFLFLTLVFNAAHAQSPWQGEWGSFHDPQSMVGGRLSISQCTPDKCLFTIERSSGTGRISTAEDEVLTLLSPTTASASLEGEDASSRCTLQLTRQTAPKPAITVIATGSTCLSYYGTGTNVTLSGVYPLRSTTPYVGLHRDECHFDNSPARLATCEDPGLAQLESHWQELADDYPLHPLTKNQSSATAEENEDDSILNTCDHDPRPAVCIQSRYIADINVMQAHKDAYLDGTTQRGDPTLGHQLALKIAGHYRHTFPNGDVQGDHYNSTDTLTIRPVGLASISFDAELNFYNGHTCSLSGGALFRKDGSFVFDDDPANKLDNEPLCRLAIIPTDKGVTFKDVSGDGCKMYCGARGTLDGASFTFSQRVAPKPAAK